MGYKVTDPIFGPPVVTYNCPACGAELKSELTDAGTRQNCPACTNELRVPGVQELQIHRDGLIAKAQKERREREQARIDKLNRDAAKGQAAQAAAQPVLVWYGAMYCHECGYNWQARRNTPPAKCPSCGRKNIEPVRVPKRATGCMGVLVLAAGAVWAVARWGS